MSCCPLSVARQGKSGVRPTVIPAAVVTLPQLVREAVLSGSSWSVKPMIALRTSSRWWRQCGGNGQ